MQGRPDTFICHASEDKVAIARPLHEAMGERGVLSWLDESEIRLGYSIRQKIDEGLAHCRSATVILSRPFFEKNWTQYEMDGIVGRAMQGELLLFPIQHGITIQEIRNHSPSLAGLHLWNTADHSPEDIAEEIATQLGITRTVSTEVPTGLVTAPSEIPTTTPAARTFGTFYIAPAETPELPPNTEPDADYRFMFRGTVEHRSWIPVLAHKEELEYLIEDDTLRVQLNWGNTLNGPEILANQMLSTQEPFALTIRRHDGSQLYLPNAINLSPTNFFTGVRTRSGWMAFKIR